MKIVLHVSIIQVVKHASWIPIEIILIYVYAILDTMDMLIMKLSYVYVKKKWYYFLQF